MKIVVGLLTVAAITTLVMVWIGLLAALMEGRWDEFNRIAKWTMEWVAWCTAVLAVIVTVVLTANYLGD